MKFHWFHLMSYPDLPDDFREKNRSVWVDVDPNLYDPEVGHHAYNEYLDELEYAGQMGFDGICVNEHHQNAYGLMPSPNLMAATLARRTTEPKIVVMGNSVALYNPPTRIAEEFAMLDCLSGGRLVAGFPVGTPMDTIFSYGEPPATLREKYREGVELILRAWQEPEPFAFNGKYTQLRYVNPWPRPLQKPHPPVWIPGGGASVETWRWCGEHNFLYAYLSYFGYEAAVKSMDAYWETMAEMNIDQNPYRAGFLQFVGVADTDAEAEKLYAEPALYFYNRCLHWYPGFTSAAGYMSVESMRKGIKSQVAQAGSALSSIGQVTSTETSWKEIVDKSYVICGSPDTVVERLEDLATRLNVGHLMLLLQFGNMGKELTMQNTHRFATEVMPKLRDKFGDHVDHWWPSSGLANEKTAQPAPINSELGGNSQPTPD